MDQLKFEQLCRDASLELGVDDTEAMGQGYTMPFAGVLFEASFQETRDKFVLIAELGGVAAENKMSVYENLLTIQLLTWAQSNMRFGFNTTRQTVVVCVQAKLGTRADGAWLAALVRSLATQVVQWRGTLLAGPVALPESDGGMKAATLEDLLAERS